MPGLAEAQPGGRQAQQVLVRLVGVQGPGLQRGSLLHEAAAQLWRQPLHVLQDLGQGLGVGQRAVRCCVGDTEVLRQVACSSGRCSDVLPLCTVAAAA
jgi:hypothetical protein